VYPCTSVLLVPPPSQHGKDGRMVAKPVSIGKGAGHAPQTPKINSAIVMQRLLRRSSIADSHGLSGTALLVIQAIAAHTREWRIEGAGDVARVVSDEAFPSQAEISKQVRRSPETVRRATLQLEEAGLLRVTRGAARRVPTHHGGDIRCPNNVYVISLPAPDVYPEALTETADTSLALVRGDGARVAAHPPRETTNSPPKNEGGTPSSCGGYPLENRQYVSVLNTQRLASETASSVSIEDGRKIAKLTRKPAGECSGRLSDGTTFGATADAARRLERGDGSSVRATPRTRDDGTQYAWLETIDEADDRTADCKRESSKPYPDNKRRVSRDDAGTYSQQPLADGRVQHRWTRGGATICKAIERGGDETDVQRFNRGELVALVAGASRIDSFEEAGDAL